MNEEKTIEPKQEEVKKEEVKPTEPRWREIIIRTNGNDINISKAEVAGNIELIAILQSLVGALSVKTKQ
jgi:hypothetical protein